MKNTKKKVLIALCLCAVIVTAVFVPCFASSPGYIAIPDSVYLIQDDGFDYWIDSNFFDADALYRYLLYFCDTESDIPSQINELCRSFLFMFNGQRVDNALSYVDGKFKLNSSNLATFMSCSDLGTSPIYISPAVGQQHGSVPMYGYFEMEIPKTGVMPSVLAVLSLVGTWVSGAVLALVSIFYVNGEMTFLGIVAVCALALAVLLFILYFVGGFLQW